MTKSAKRIAKNTVQVVESPWPVVQLRDVAAFAHGSTPSKAHREYWEGMLPWASPKDFKGNRLTVTEDHISESAVAARDAVIALPDSLLVVVRSGILKRRLPVCVVDVRMAFNQDVKCIRPDTSHLNPEYLALVLRTAEPLIIQNGVKVGPTVHSIKSGYLENLEIPLPPLPEQQRIATWLTMQLAVVERARAAALAQLAAVEALPAALLREAFGERQRSSA